MGKEGIFDGIDLDFLSSQEDGVEIPDTEAENNDLEQELEDFQEEEESEEEQSTNIDEQTPSDKGAPSSPISSLTFALHEEGVLSSLSKEELEKITSGEELIEAIRKQIKENEFSDLSQEQRDYLEAVRNGVPEEEFKSSKKRIIEYSKIDEDILEDEQSANLRYNLIVNSFISKGFDEETSKKYATRAVDLGEDVEDAKKALTTLKKQEQEYLKSLSESKKQEQEAFAKAQQERTEAFKTKVKSLTEVIPNIRVNDTMKEKVLEVMTKTVAFDKNNNPMNAVVKAMVENPDYLVKLHYLHTLTNGLEDWSKLTNSAKTAAVTKLEESLQRQESKIKFGADSVGNKRSTNALINALDNLGI